MNVGELEIHKFYSNKYVFSNNYKIHDTIAYMHPISYDIIGMQNNVVNASKRKIYKLCDEDGVVHTSSINGKEINLNYDDPFITLDPNIAETISILNKKCYFTKYCCEGHADHKENAYIGFNKIMQSDSMIIDRLVYNLPITWYLDEYSNNVISDMIIIRSDYCNHDEAMIDILNWANSLPDLRNKICLKVLGGNYYERI